MKKIKKCFERAGFLHKQLIRVGDVAIFERSPLYNKDNIHYEIVRINRHNGYKAGKNYIRAAETYPGGSLWGMQGWTCTTLDAAEHKFKIACDHFNKQKEELAYA